MNDVRRNGKVRFGGPLVKPAASLKNKEGRRPEREKEDDDMWISATTMKNEIHCAAAGEMKFVGSAKFFPPKKQRKPPSPNPFHSSTETGVCVVRVMVAKELSSPQQRDTTEQRRSIPPSSVRPSLPSRRFAEWYHLWKCSQGCGDEG